MTVWMSGQSGGKAACAPLSTATPVPQSQTLASTLLQHPEASDTPPALFLLSLQIPNLSFPSTDPLPHPPYSELWVYFVDVDVVKSHDFGELGRVPSVHSWEVRETKLLAVQTRPLGTATEGNAQPPLL